MELNNAILFMGLCLFGPMFISVLLDAIEKLERPQPITKTEYVEVKTFKYIKPVKPVKSIKPIKTIAKPIEPVKVAEDPKLKDECLECLVSLGMKKAIAKSKVNKMWASKNYNSIESFLIDAYRV
jgi:hypothetical protein